jgi:hypothetical protein
VINLVKKGLTYDSNCDRFTIDDSITDEVELLEVAHMCINLAIDAVILSSNVNNYFTENNQLYLDALRLVNANISDRCFEVSEAEEDNV